MAEAQTPTAAERKAIRVARAALDVNQSPNTDVVETVVAALGSAKLLQSPETAAAEVSAKVLTGVADAIGGVGPGPQAGRDYATGWRSAVHAVTKQVRHMAAQFAAIAEDDVRAAETPVPATVEFFVDGTVTLTGWRLTELAPDYYGTSHMQLSGWLPEEWEPGSVSLGTNHMVQANLPGRCAGAQDVNVEVEVKRYGGPRCFMKIRWPHTHDGESARESLGEFVPCVNACCQQGEWSGKATERGWEQTDEGWLCPQCAADAADRRDYLQAKAEGGEAL